MGRPLYTSPGQLSADRIIATLNRGRAVIIRLEAPDGSYEVELRLSNDELYYCDGPMGLHTHDSEQELRTWLVNRDYADQ